VVFGFLRVFLAFLWAALLWVLIGIPSRVWLLLVALPLRRLSIWSRLAWSLAPWGLTALVVDPVPRLIAKHGGATLAPYAIFWVDRLSRWTFIARSWADSRPMAWMQANRTSWWALLIPLGWSLANVFVPLFVLSLLYGGPFWVLWFRKVAQTGTSTVASGEGRAAEGA